MPLAVVELVIAGVPGEIVIVSVVEPVPPLFVALTVTLEKVPAAEGVPEITPVEVLIVKPEGNPLAP